MKPLLLLIVLIIFHGCDTQPKEHRLIQNYLKANLDDPDSYEPVEFGDATEAYSPAKFSNKVKKLVDSLRTLENEFDSLSMVFDVGKSEEMANLDKRKSLILVRLQLSDKVNRESKGYDSTELLGYKMTHKFRSKNKMGALVLEEEEFLFNQTMDTVLKMFGGEK